MKRSKIPALMAAALLSLVTTTAWAADQQAAGDSPDAALFKTVSALDTAVFDSFNHCSDPAQLKLHASFFAPDVEFYHDKGGVTWTRQDMLANTAKNVCGNFRRELVEGSLRVYPIKDYGAIELGTHRFCQFKSNDCEGIADFVVIWTHQNDEWKITRVMSFGHRANTAGAQ
jgi:hypothetical protein